MKHGSGLPELVAKEIRSSRKYTALTNFILLSGKQKSGTNSHVVIKFKKYIPGMDMMDNPNYYSTGRHYKPKMICCDCRKVFKRKLASDFESQEQDFETAMICPNCGKAANYVGPKFRAPKSDNSKAWKSLEVLQSIRTIHFMGWANNKVIIPESKKELDDLLTNMKLSCEANIRKWLSADYNENNKVQIKYFSDIMKRIDKRIKT